jgi:hypothetical protein
MAKSVAFYYSLAILVISVFAVGAKLDESCANNLDCVSEDLPTQVVHCIQEKCKCKDDFVSVSRRHNSDEKDRCLLKAFEGLNSNCEVNLQCNSPESLGFLSKCNSIDGKCICFDSKTPSNTLPDEVYWDEETKKCTKHVDLIGPVVVLLAGVVTSKLFCL